MMFFQSVLPQEWAMLARETRTFGRAPLHFRNQPHKAP
jgi:hypothetical protein